LSRPRGGDALLIGFDLIQSASSGNHRVRPRVRLDRHDVRERRPQELEHVRRDRSLIAVGRLVEGAQNKREIKGKLRKELLVRKYPHLAKCGRHHLQIEGGAPVLREPLFTATEEGLKDALKVAGVNGVLGSLRILDEGR
jgi:hypothetical protein